MVQLPKTYAAAVFEKANTPLVIKDFPLKQPGLGQVLVKVLASGVCHTDCLVQAGMAGNSFPIIPGHEIIGDVIVVGPGVDRWHVGDRVGGPFHGGHDGSCVACQKGDFQMCEHQVINGVTKDGGYAEYMLLRSEATVPVPKDVDPAEYAPILCAGVTVFNGMRRQKITPGSLVAIEGIGGLGHLAIQYSKAMGFRTVAISHSAAKESFALDLGAHAYIDSSSEDVSAKLKSLGGAAMIVATSPKGNTTGALTGGLANHGTLLVLSVCGEIKVNSVDLIQKAVNVTGFPSGYALDSEETIAFTRLHGIKCMIEKFPLRDAAKALEHISDVRFRSVLIP